MADRKPATSCNCRTTFNVIGCLISSSLVRRLGSGVVLERRSGGARIIVADPEKSSPKKYTLTGYTTEGYRRQTQQRKSVRRLIS